MDGETTVVCLGLLVSFSSSTGTDRDTSAAAGIDGTGDTDGASNPEELVDKARRMFAFDCNENAENWHESWSSMKKEWCCLHVSMGCPNFECDATDTWEHSWSSHKKAWCCLHEDLGCPSFSCDKTDDWEESWSSHKKMWCCIHSDVGCTAVFDCQDQLSTFVTDWTPHKKTYCCTHQSLGCWDPLPPSAAEHQLSHVALLLKNVDSGAFDHFGRITLQEIIARSVATAAGIDPQDVIDSDNHKMAVTVAGPSDSRAVWWPHGCPTVVDGHASITLASGLATLTPPSFKLLSSTLKSRSFEHTLSAEIGRRILEPGAISGGSSLPIRVSARRVPIWRYAHAWTHGGPA